MRSVTMQSSSDRSATFTMATLPNLELSAASTTRFAERSSLDLMEASGRPVLETPNSSSMASADRNRVPKRIREI